MSYYSKLLTPAFSRLDAVERAAAWADEGAERARRTWRPEHERAQRMSLYAPGCAVVGKARRSTVTRALKRSAAYWRRAYTFAGGQVTRFYELVDGRIAGTIYEMMAPTGSPLAAQGEDTAAVLCQMLDSIMLGTTATTAHALTFDAHAGALREAITAACQRRYLIARHRRERRARIVTASFGAAC